MSIGAVIRSSTAQRGAALLVILLALGALALLFGVKGWLDSDVVRQRRVERTRIVLAQAKEALLAYVAGRTLAAAWPGDLPCPDRDDDGVADPPCSAAGERLGRLPWKTLGVDDLRDASGERLWYAVSRYFANNPRLSPRNSDTAGSITVRDATGQVIHCAHAAACPGGDPATGAVALVLAPGAPLARPGGMAQDRSPANRNVAAHFLDAAAFEDNAGFADDAVDGLFLGPVKNAAGDPVANDEAIVIAREDIDRAMRDRVAGEARLCLAEYRNTYSYLPWLVPLADTANYRAAANTRLGRLPLDFSALPPGEGQGTNWSGHCYLVVDAWWANWREQVFAVIDPACAPPGGSGCPASCSLLVNGRPNQCFAVFVAGRVLAGQNRSVKDNLANYLEGENLDGGAPASPFATCATPGCNDLVVSGQ